jgi:sialate O-acetylesterase
MEAGRRLALHALKNNYGKNVVAQSPAFKGMEIKGDTIIVDIETFEDQLVCKNKHGYAYGFAIAAEGGAFQWAKATLKGNKIIVYSEKVKIPVAVRYAWSKNPGPLNIYNKAGLPLRPFRTDKRPGITDGRVFDLDKVFF